MNTRTVIDVYDNGKPVMQGASIKEVIMAIDISRASLYRCTKLGCTYNKRYRFIRRTRGGRYETQRYLLYLENEIVMENASIDRIAAYLGLACSTVYNEISNGRKLKKVYDWDEADLPKKLLTEWDNVAAMFHSKVSD